MRTTLDPVALVQVHAEGIAQRGGSAFEDPRVINQYVRVLTHRGEDWAASVLGRNLMRRSLTWGPWLEPGEPEILVLADRAEGGQ